MVKATAKTKLTLAAVLLAAGTTFAMAQTGGGNAGSGAGGGPPNGTDTNARSQVQQNATQSHKARRHIARRHRHMRSMPTGMGNGDTSPNQPGLLKNNSTGNMNTKGTGRGTTGTGGPGGSGNQ